ncbi:hypothetical protein [Lysobacter xanthus]
METMSQPSSLKPQPEFFPVSVGKLAIMSVCTLGLYQIYWFYWNWRLLKRRENRSLSAPWRSVLGLFFAFPLFRRMARPAGRLGSAVALACFIAWVGLSLVGYGPMPLAALTFASVLPLLPMQAFANRSNALSTPEHRNSKLRGWNIVAVVFGGLLVLLNLLALAVHAAQA